MFRAVPALILSLIVGVPTAMSARAATVGPVTQVELDRIVSRVNGRMITESDVRRARVLKLVDDTGSDQVA
jgi:hypothetical protein